MSDGPKTGVGDFFGAIRSPGAPPALAFMLLAGIAAAGATFVAGLVIALLTNEDSIFRIGSVDVSSPKEAMAQAAGFTLAGLTLASEDGFEITLRSTPATFVIFPIGFNLLAALLLKPQLQSVQRPWARLAWGAAVALPFAVVMLVFALVAADLPTQDGDAEVTVNAAAAFFLGLLWGAIGGATGVVLSTPKGEREGLAIPGAWGQVWLTIRTALKPLVVLIAIFTVIGTTFWVVQTIRDAGGVQSGESGFDSDLVTDDAEERPTYQATIENSLYALDHGVHYTALSSGMSFYAPTFATLAGVPALGMPLPVEDPEEVVDFDALETEVEESIDGVSDVEDSSNGDEVYTSTNEALRNIFSPSVTFSVFDYKDGVATWVFVLLLVLFALPVLAAVYAGFAVARVRRSANPLTGGVWGSMVGPIWMAALLLLNTLIQKDVMGKGEPDSVFVVSLLAGLGLGALGGLIGSQGADSSE